MKRISIFNSSIKNNPAKRMELEAKLKRNGFYTTREGELLIVLGGDGTFLSAVRKRMDQNPVFVGFNAGNLGFYSEFTMEDADRFIHMLKTQQYWVEELPVYEVRYKDDLEEKVEYFCNDLVVERKGTNVLHMEVQCNGETLCHIDGDGLIVASAAGSTGYNLSAGGPILTKQDRMLLTPISPLPVTEAYRSAQDSLIVRNKEELTIFPNVKKQRAYRIVCDGRELRTKQPRYVEVTKSNKVIRVLRSSDYSTLGHIQKKMSDHSPKN